MNLPSCTSARRWQRALAALLLLAASALAWAQPGDPPTRVAYLSALEGPVHVSTDGPGSWVAASLNWPVTTGTQLQLGAGARAELDGGWLALRLQGPAELNTTTLDDTHTQWALTAGSAALRVRQPPADERIELDTPQLALVADEPGEYRLDVDPGTDTTRVTVRAGSATLYGQAGQSMPVAAGQQLVLAGRDLTLLSSAAAPPRDAFDQWVAAREQQRTQSAAAAYVSPDMPGYAELDPYGQWAVDASYGPVWYPRISALDWAPYRDGRWIWVSPWGWTWVDDAPWGFAPFHYGRWTQIGPRWAWVPGPRVRRPVYAPALVQFVGAGNGWSVSVGAPAIGWFPLAPGERWHPPYHASSRYRERLNDWGHWHGRAPASTGDYFFRHRPGAISIAAHGSFERDRWPAARPPRYEDGRRLPAGWLQDSRPLAPPARPPGRPEHAQRPPRPEAGVALPRPWGQTNLGADEPARAGAWNPGRRPATPEAGVAPPRPPARFGPDAPAQPGVSNPGPGTAAQGRRPERQPAGAERPPRGPEFAPGHPLQRRPEWAAPAAPPRPAAPAWQPPRTTLGERPAAERPRPHPAAPALDFTPAERQRAQAPEFAPPRIEREREREREHERARGARAPQQPRATLGDSDR